MRPLNGSLHVYCGGEDRPSPPVAAEGAQRAVISDTRGTLVNGQEGHRFAMPADRPLVAASIAKMLRNCRRWRAARNKRPGARTPRVRVSDCDRCIRAMRAGHWFVVRGGDRRSGLRRVQLHQPGRAPFGGAFFLSIACGGYACEQSDSDRESDDSPDCGDFRFHIWPFYFGYVIVGGHPTQTMRSTRSV